MINFNRLISGMAIKNLKSGKTYIITRPVVLLGSYDVQPPLGAKNNEYVEMLSWLIPASDILNNDQYNLGVFSDDMPNWEIVWL